MWICDVCKTSSESEKVATLRQLIHAMSKSHSDEIQALTTCVQELILKVDAMSAAPDRGSANTANVINTGTVWDNVRSSIVVKPDPQGNKLKISMVKKFATERGIPIDSVVESSNGDTFINTPDVESRDKVMESLQESHAANEVVKLKSKVPTISVMGVEACHMTNQDDEEMSKEELRTAIYRQNRFIAPLMDKDNSELEVVFVKPPPAQKKFYSVYIRVSPDIRSAIKTKNRNKIHFGGKVFNVDDRFHVKRCNRCQGLGHYADKCDTENNPVTCGYCAKDHDSNDCRDKNKPCARHVCINCSGEGKNAHGHPAFLSKCPTYKAAQEKMKKTIPYYDTLN